MNDISPAVVGLFDQFVLLAALFNALFLLAAIVSVF
ncbi:hypothetical protein EDD75_0377 [Thermodesulfitimonas autotrophica]|uniref:Uncharacterized protein n=1 Tax=Thermodesulfitimonas autotrophica TaxID=1894989 RepID=A0A3N5B1R1_9THEO|nr:hypothetical protein EDD75_0377 [Thermodesulfitimonas autotrophica]